MIRSVVATLALLTASLCFAGETFPVDHREPITLRVLSGKDGRPLPHVHLVLFAGYDQNDVHRRQWSEETLTDDQGKAKLSSYMANLPFLQVWVAKKALCLSNPKKISFSVERIRRDGFSSPNRCGIATVEDAPGTLIVFVKGKGAKTQPVSKTATVQTAQPVEVAAVKSEMAVVAKVPVQKAIAVEVNEIVPSVATAAAVSTAVTATATDGTPKPAASAATATLTATTTETKSAALLPTKANAPSTPRKPAVHKTAARKSVAKTKPALLPCQAALPPAQPTPAATPAKPKPEAAVHRAPVAYRPRPHRPAAIKIPLESPPEKPSTGGKPPAGTPSKTEAPKPPETPVKKEG